MHVRWFTKGICFDHRKSVSILFFHFYFVVFGKWSMIKTLQYTYIFLRFVHWHQQNRQRDRNRISASSCLANTIWLNWFDSIPYSPPKSPRWKCSEVHAHDLCACEQTISSPDICVCQLYYNVSFYKVHRFFTVLFLAWKKNGGINSFWIILMPGWQKTYSEDAESTTVSHCCWWQSCMLIIIIFIFILLLLQCIDAKWHIFIFIARTKLLSKTFDVRKLPTVSVSHCWNCSISE